jgi:hypothetical protein
MRKIIGGMIPLQRNVGFAWIFDYPPRELYVGAGVISGFVATSHPHWLAGDNFTLPYAVASRFYSVAAHIKRPHIP